MTLEHAGHRQHADAQPIADAIAALSAGLFAQADGPPYTEVLAQLAEAQRQIAALADQARAGELEALTTLLARAAGQAATLSSKPGLTDDDVLALADAIDEIAAQARMTPPIAEPLSDTVTVQEPESTSVPSPEVTQVEQPTPHADAVLEREPSEPEAVRPDVAPSEGETLEQSGGSESTALASTEAPTVESPVPLAEPVAAAVSAVVEEPSPGPDPTDAAAPVAPADPSPICRDPIADVLELDTLAGSIAAREEQDAGLVVATPESVEPAPQPVNAAAPTDTPPAEPLTPAPTSADDAETGPTRSDDVLAAVPDVVSSESPAVEPIADDAPATEPTAENVIVNASVDAPPAAIDTAEPSASPAAELGSDPVPAVEPSIQETSEEAPATTQPVVIPEAAQSPAEPEPAPLHETPPQPASVPDVPSDASSDASRVNDCWTSLQIDPASVIRVDLVTKLDAGQQAIVGSLAKDARSIAADLNRLIERLRGGVDAGVAPVFTTMSDGLARTGSFFNFTLLNELAELLKKLGEGIDAAPPPAAAQLVRVLPRCALVLTLFGDGLDAGHELQVPVGRIIEDSLAALAGTLAESTDAPAAAEAAPQGAIADSGAAAELTPEQMLAMLGAEQEPCGWGTVPLSLPPERAETLQFLVNDIKQAADQINGPAEHLADLGVRGDTCAELVRLEALLSRAMRDFDFRSLRTLIRLVGDIGYGLDGVAEDMLPELNVRLLAVQSLIQQHAVALEVGMETTWPLDTLVARIHRLLSGQTLSPSIVGWHRGNVERVTELDLVVEGVDPPPKVDPVEDRASWTRPAEAVAKAATDDLIRVRAAIIDELLGTVGELVQHNARLHMVSAQLRREQPRLPGVDDLCRTSELMQRAMVALQTGIMGTRMQPIARLLDNYPRVARDVGRLADREVQLSVCGGETLVDRSLLEAISEPLMMIVRCVASTLIEPPAERQKAGKPTAGSIFITVAQRGSQVVVTLEDDGCGFDRKAVMQQTVDAGLLTAEQAEALSDTDLYALLMEPDLTGSPLRGVGNMLSSSIGASFRIASTPGQGTRIDLFIPMKSVILPSVVVAVGAAQYTVPLSSVLEIVKINEDAVKTIGRAPCLRLRGDVLAMVDARELFSESASALPSYAIVVTNGQRVAALGVDRVINKQDMIIAQIEDEKLRQGPFSGTTLTQEGRVSLVIDVQRVLALVADTHGSP